MRYRIHLQMLKMAEKIKFDWGLRKAGLLGLVIFESLSLAIHAPPKVNFLVSFGQQGNKLVYSFDILIAVFTCTRTYLIYKFMALYSKWNSNLVNSICSKHHAQGGINFALKAEMATRPYAMIAMSFVLTILTFGYSEVVLERPYIYVSGQNWNNLWNGFWNVIVLVSTVGYGDFYPRTHGGRFIMTICMVFGTFLTSLAVVALTISSQFTEGEENSYRDLVSIRNRIELLEKANNTIKTSYRYWRLLRGQYPSTIKPTQTYRYRNNMNAKFKHGSIDFSTFRKSLVANESCMSMNNTAKRAESMIKYQLDLLKLATRRYKLANELLEDICSKYSKISQRTADLIEENKLALSEFKRKIKENGKKVMEMRLYEECRNVILEFGEEPLKMEEEVVLEESEESKKTRRVGNRTQNQGNWVEKEKKEMDEKKKKSVAAAKKRQSIKLQKLVNKYKKKKGTKNQESERDGNFRTEGEDGDALKLSPISLQTPKIDVSQDSLIDGKNEGFGPNEKEIEKLKKLIPHGRIRDKSLSESDRVLLLSFIGRNESQEPLGEDFSDSSLSEGSGQETISENSQESEESKKSGDSEGESSKEEKENSARSHETEINAEKAKNNENVKIKTNIQGMKEAEGQTKPQNSKKKGVSMVYEDSSSSKGDSKKNSPNEAENKGISFEEIDPEDSSEASLSKKQSEPIEKKKVKNRLEAQRNLWVSNDQRTESLKIVEEMGGQLKRKGLNEALDGGSGINENSDESKKVGNFIQRKEQENESKERTKILEKTMKRPKTADNAFMRETSLEQRPQREESKGKKFGELITSKYRSTISKLKDKKRVLKALQEKTD